jgi:hypothetical protein
MANGTTINLSEYSRDVIQFVKESREHKNYDSALRDIFEEADFDTDEMVDEIRDEDDGAIGGWKPAE